jgi:hypothetical protein
VRALRERTDESAKALLNADQLPLYQQMRQEERRERDERGPGRQPGGHP